MDICNTNVEFEFVFYIQDPVLHYTLHFTVTNKYIKYSKVSDMYTLVDSL